MSIELEEFSLRHFIPQFREVNSATSANRKRLEPWFWWADINSLNRFRFLLSGLLMEKIARIAHDLRYNKKFIIRNNGEFAGMIGLDDVAQNALRAELWIFVTENYLGAHVASNAIKLIEEYATKKSIKNIYARVDQKNQNSKNMLAANNYILEQTKLNFWRKVWETHWNKSLTNKSVEK